MRVVLRLGVLTMPRRLRLWNKKGTVPNFNSAEKESASRDSRRVSKLGRLSKIAGQNYFKQT